MGVAAAIHAAYAGDWQGCGAFATGFLAGASAVVYYFLGLHESDRTSEGTPCEFNGR